MPSFQMFWFPGEMSVFINTHEFHEKCVFSPDLVLLVLFKFHISGEYKAPVAAGSSIIPFECKAG